MPTYPAQNTIFFNALPACFGVLHGVARAAVQQPVEAGTGAVDEIALLKQQSLDAAHGKVAQHARAGSAAAYDHHVVMLSGEV